MTGDIRLSTARPVPFWTTTVPPLPACLPATSDLSCDLAIVGGGFTGLWSALKARERHPDATIVVLEAKRCGQDASGRNGGFCAPSISHGVSNALTRHTGEAERLIRLGRDNLDHYARDLERYGMNAGFERSGKLNVAATPWQAQGLQDMARNYARFGIEHSLLSGAELAEKLDSPVYSAGLFEPNYALVDPARTVAELRRVCLQHGVTICENSGVSKLSRDGTVLKLDTAQAVIRAKQVILATNSAKPLLKRLSLSFIPIYDYSLVTEPMTEAQWASIGWTDRYGIADCGNQFHYFRKTADNRMLWAGYDAIYHYGSDRSDALLQRDASFQRLADQFAAAFPSLSDVRFDHAWGGIIDTSARTTFFSGLAYGGQLAYAMGFTGQGVSASRFAALTMLDLLNGADTERTRLKMPRRWAVPFPPEPIRSIAVKMAQKDLAREDETGHRSAVLRLLDAFGIGLAS
ncbi:NAD(P)/FAD-dependent oxidoreductase [Celeribacter baekdonensis]|uniref:FAD-dependent oxidoreductase n=1 Tax=Celeribacter baekdonensis TaxID=875171 RepID=A0A2R4M641_9RHOB|nr:FAD-dependent oxidoreductase [Celeribacter baekdonensis]AVW92681.1 FAD-dependent oxidoreductase [Celeribacter baekdonensis]